MTLFDSRTICQWEIWQVEWDHEDGTSKSRPALVLSSSTFNATNDEIWFAKISSKRHHVAHVLELSTNDAAFRSTGLSGTSFFYLANTRKIHRSKIQRRRGILGTMSILMTRLAMAKAVPKGFP